MKLTNTILLSLSEKINRRFLNFNIRFFSNVAADKLDFGFLRGGEHNQRKIEGEDGDNEKKVGNVPVPIGSLRGADGENKISRNHYAQTANKEQKPGLHSPDANS